MEFIMKKSLKILWISLITIFAIVLLLIIVDRLGFLAFFQLGMNILIIAISIASIYIILNPFKNKLLNYLPLLLEGFLVFCIFYDFVIPKYAYINHLSKTYGYNKKDIVIKRMNFTCSYGTAEFGSSPEFCVSIKARYNDLKIRGERVGLFKWDDSIKKEKNDKQYETLLQSVQEKIKIIIDRYDIKYSIRQNTLAVNSLEVKFLEANFASPNAEIYKEIINETKKLYYDLVMDGHALQIQLDSNIPFRSNSSAYDELYRESNNYPLNYEEYSLMNEEFFNLYSKDESNVFYQQGYNLVQYSIHLSSDINDDSTFLHELYVINGYK